MVMDLIHIFSGSSGDRRDKMFWWVFEEEKFNMNAERGHLVLEICPSGKLLDNAELYRYLFLKLFTILR